MFTGRTDVEAETPVLWPPDAKDWLIGKDPDAGKDWEQEEKGMTEDEMVGWHHWLGFGWTPGVGDGQAGLTCCGSWGHKESDMTERLSWTELITCSPLSSWVFFYKIQVNINEISEILICGWMIGYSSSNFNLALNCWANACRIFYSYGEIEHVTGSAWVKLICRNYCVCVCVCVCVCTLCHSVSNSLWPH